MAEVTVPSSCAIALKEWASVLAAMERGEQLILIRKGGLIEPGSGFKLASSSFVFYPTFEHQTVHYLRPASQRSFEEVLRNRPDQGHVRITLFGIAASSSQCHDPAMVERLSPFHIYNEAFLQQRLKWQPDQPLVIVVVRAFRLAAPRLLPLAPHYAGCKSWVDLASPVPLDGARSVLDDATFQQRAREIAALLLS